MISLLTLLSLGMLGPGLGSLIDVCTKNKNSVREPLLAALLDLYSGEHCSIPNVASFQQLAVLESTVKQIRKNNKLKIGFQVFDTCSTEQGAATASIQAFVASQQTCLHSPLFSGFIGPENPKFLKAVKNFTGSFNFTHIMTYSVSDNTLNPTKTVYVAKYPVNNFAEAIEELVIKMALKSPLIITENTPRSHSVSIALRNAKPGPDVCSKRVVFTISSPEEFEEIIDFGRIHDGLIILLESENLLKSVNRILDSDSIQDPVILGVLHNSPTQQQYSWNENVLIINQVSLSESERNFSSMAMSVSNAIHAFVTDASHICAKYKLSTCDDKLLSRMMEEEYDWTLQLYRMAVLLLSSAVEAAQKLKCDSKPCLSPDVISQTEWHNILRSSSVVMDSRQGEKSKISFGMDIPASYIIKTSFGPDGLKKIGRVVNSEMRLSSRDVLLPTRMKNVSCTIIKQTIEKITTVSSTEVDFLDSWLKPENAKLFEAAGLVCGAVVGVLLVMLILTTCVYRNFKSESSHSKSPSSHTTMSRAGSISS